MQASTISTALTVKIASHSEANKSYTVTFPVNAEPYCECKGYGYRKTCSHIKEAADMLLDQFIKQQSQLPPGAMNHTHDLQHFCLTCGAPLTGTHAMLDKCAACYRKEVFSHAS